jgi:hypothetical protein
MGTPPPSGGPKKPHVLRRPDAPVRVERDRRNEARTTEIDTRALAHLIHDAEKAPAPAADLDAVIEVVDAKAPSEKSRPATAVVVRSGNVLVRGARPVPRPPAAMPEGSGAMEPTPPDRKPVAPPLRVAALPPAEPQAAAVMEIVEDDPYRFTKRTTAMDALGDEAQPPVPAIEVALPAPEAPEMQKTQKRSRAMFYVAALLLLASAGALAYVLTN